jgi:hypothetical protein
MWYILTYFVGYLIAHEVHLNDVYKLSPYHTENTLRLRYKAQPVNAV